MNRLALLSLVCVMAATACLGSSASRPAPAATHLEIAYSIGSPTRTAAAVRRGCPRGARCHVTRLAPGVWTLAVDRTLTCDPPGGGYPSPTRACQALADLERILHTQPRIVCGCAATIGISAGAHGLLDGRLATVPLDPCTYCDQGSGAQHDLQILTPNAT